MKTKNLFWGAVMLLLTASCSRDKSSDEYVLGLNEAIHHDDFEYVVTDFTFEKQIGDGDNALMPKGRFLIVSFKTVNNAKRVRHEWDNTVAYVTDKSGAIYENDPDTQQVLERTNPFGWSERYITGPSESQSTRLVFDLPDSVTEPYLMVHGSTLMGDFFDGNQFRKTKIKLF